MNKKIKNLYLVSLVALFLGGICFYIYIPLYGNAFSFLMEQEFYRQIQRIVFNLGEQGGLFFKLFNFLQDAIFLFIVCTIVFYFFAERLRKTLPYSMLFLIAGAIASDYYSYVVMAPIMSQIPFPKEIPYSYSSEFFGNSILAKTRKLCMLGGVFYVSIVIGNKVNIGSLKKYLIKNKQENKLC
nr:hypothetical protein [uncultured bacterium]